MLYINFIFYIYTNPKTPLGQPVLMAPLDMYILKHQSKLVFQDVIEYNIIGNYTELISKIKEMNTIYLSNKGLIFEYKWKRQLILRRL